MEWIKTTDKLPPKDRRFIGIEKEKAHGELVIGNYEWDDYGMGRGSFSPIFMEIIVLDDPIDLHDHPITGAGFSYWCELPKD